MPHMHSYVSVIHQYIMHIFYRVILYVSHIIHHFVSATHALICECHTTIHHALLLGVIGHDYDVPEQQIHPYIGVIGVATSRIC